MTDSVKRPWGVTDPAELWTSLAQRLLEQLEGKGTKPGTWFGRWTLKHDGTIKTAIQTAKEALGKFSPVGGFSPVLDEIRKLLNTTAKQLSSLAKGSERIVVMIDDVDRVDPRLVPPILFALRELFDVPRFSWILAIDPVVVRAALKQHHPGFALGQGASVNCGSRRNRISESHRDGAHRGRRGRDTPAVRIPRCVQHMDSAKASAVP